MAKVFVPGNSDQRPGCAEYSAIDFTGFQPFTFCAWVKVFTDIPQCVIACKSGTTHQYSLTYENKKFVASVNDSGITRSATTTNDYDDNVWYHVALVFNGNHIRLKINAGITEEIIGPNVFAGITNTSEAFTVGQFSSGGSSSTRFYGSVAQVCIFDKDLTNNELSLVMVSGPRMVSNLTLWFPLIDENVADVNLAPISTKTAVTGVNTSFTMDILCPPLGSMFGTTALAFAIQGNHNLTVSATDSLNTWLDAQGVLNSSSGLNNWQDSLTVASGYFIEAFDSMFFNLFDALQISFSGSTGGGSAADQFVMSDSLAALLSGAVSVGDSLSFADSFGGTFFAVNAFGDQLFLSDLAGLQMGIGLAFTDTLSMSDGTNNSASTQFLVSVADTMNFWADSVSYLSSTGETTYLRQYLNDVVN